MARLGWLGLTISAEFGGEGGDAVDMVTLVGEMGRALLPSPYITSAVACGHLIALAGSRAQREGMLPLVANGQLILSLALDDEIGGSPAALTPSGGGYRLNGAKAFVSFAESADRLTCVVHGSGYTTLCLFFRKTFFGGR